jgi:tRNA pseudouridine55 synthase
MKRVGHAGTLDPMATGVLLVCLGQATRLSEYLMGGKKVYRAEVTFGTTTHSQDSSGQVIEVKDASGLTREAVEALLPRFTGEILQLPPMVSALHHEGKRLYDLARQGIEVERQPRPVTIYRLNLLRFAPGDPPRAEVRVECSSGTYIRTLAHDLGGAAGCGAHMSGLVREAVGAFTLADSVTLEQVEEAAGKEEFHRLLSPMTVAIEGHPLVQLREDQLNEVRFGKALPAEPDLPPSDLVGLVGPDGELAALAVCRFERLYPFKVLLGPS